MPKSTLRMRAQQSAARIMRNDDRKTPLPHDLAELVAEVIARWWIKTGAVSVNNDRISIAAEGRLKAVRVARCVAWMKDGDRHHGQQAKECAEKTLRALRSRSIGAEQLFERCEEFGSLRKRHIARANTRMPRLAPRKISLTRFGIVTRWLTAEVDIDRVGHAMRNCLANTGFAKDYKRRMRNREVELIVLEDNDGDPVVLICADTATQCLEQIQGPANDRPIKHRKAIIATLAECQFRVEENSELLNLAISDELLKARADKTTVRFAVGGRECEVGDGFVAAVMGDETILLRAQGYQSWGSEVCVVGNDNNDTDCAKQTKARSWFRRACDGSPAFARACRAAFPDDALIDFRDDWFTLSGADRRGKVRGGRHFQRSIPRNGADDHAVTTRTTHKK